MTEKELLYFEDAIGHIGNISKLLNDFTGKVNNQEIKDFFNDENNNLQNLKENLINVLRGESNG